MSKEKSVFLAVDVGGTNVSIGLVSRAGEVLNARHFATRSSQRSPEDLVDEMVTNLKAAAEGAPEGLNAAAISIGMPGWINPREGVLELAPNMPGWSNVPIAKIIEDRMGLPARLENDTNLYSLGEWLTGAGQGMNNLVVLTLGTGVGGGLILNGHLWGGCFASAAEVGHMPVEENGALCGCGAHGCLETIASATGLMRLGRKWLADGHKTAYNGAPADLTPQIMHDLAKSGDPMALNSFETAGKALGFVLTGIFNLLGLEGAVIGGGVAGAYEFIYPQLWRVLSDRLVTANPEDIKVLPGQLGESAPLVGGAALLKHLGY